MKPKSPLRTRSGESLPTHQSSPARQSSPQHHASSPSSSSSKTGGAAARMLLYLVGIGCFVHVIWGGRATTTTMSRTVLPSMVPNQAGSSHMLLGESSHPQQDVLLALMGENGQTKEQDKEDDSMDELDDYEQHDTPLDATTTTEATTDVATTTQQTEATSTVAASETAATEQATTEEKKETQKETTGKTTTSNKKNIPDEDCPEIQVKESTKLYQKDFAQNYPVQAPKDIVEDWDAIPCAHMPPNCDLQDLSHGHPFIMVSFGRSGTTSTWDIVAALTGEYIPKASEDMGRDKGESVEFFASLNQTEHGKCWLERLLCEKQMIVKKAAKKRLGKAAIYGSKWKPWHLGLNTTQARQALQWLGTQKQIKVLHNTRNMVDMFISQYKHVVLNRLFGDERTAHCYDDRDLKLSEGAWKKLEDMGISRETPCAQIFKLIEARTSLNVGHMVDYFERNSVQTDYVVNMMDYYNIDRVTVTYEKLYFTDNAEEWMRIFRYLGFGPQQNLTLDQVVATTTFQKTSANDRSKRMANYDEVYKALQCTRYATFLD